METVRISGLTRTAALKLTDVNLGRFKDLGVSAESCRGEIIDTRCSCRGVLVAQDSSGIGVAIKPFFEPFGPIDWEMEEAATQNIDCEFQNGDTITLSSISVVFVDFTSVSWDLRGGKGSKIVPGAVLGLGYTSITLTVSGTVHY